MKEYKIVKPSIWTRDYQIVSQEGTEKGSLKWEGAFSTRVNATSRFENYTFKRNNWNTNVTIIDRR